MDEELQKEMKKYHHFKRASMKLKDVLPLIRISSCSNYDECGTDIILCPECEEWTHVRFNAHSGLLDLLGELIVESILVDDDDILLWIKTDEFNWFNIEREGR